MKELDAYTKYTINGCGNEEYDYMLNVSINTNIIQYSYQ